MKDHRKSHIKHKIWETRGTKRQEWYETRDTIHKTKRKETQRKETRETRDTRQKKQELYKIRDNRFKRYKRQILYNKWSSKLSLVPSVMSITWQDSL